MPLHRVVIVGGGFGGLQAALALGRAPVEVTLVDRRNFHLFQPLLYQVATGGLSPANIAAPLRGVLHRQKNTRVVLGEVTGFDVSGRRVLLDGGGALPFDSLIVASGSSHSYFGHDDWEKFAPGLKTVEDATAMRRRILIAFEEAEKAATPEERTAWLTFVLVGGGPTGVELAGAIGELAHWTFRDNFRAIDPARARILVIEGNDRILPTYPPDLSAKAVRSLQRLGAEVMTSALVVDVRPDGVTVRHAAGKSGDPAARDERIVSRTVLWSAGVAASPLGKRIAEACGATTDRAGRVTVQPDLTLPGHPEIFVAGDLAIVRGTDGQPLPGVAQVAIQEGRYAARLIAARLEGRTLPPFRYNDLGIMATIGRAAAVAVIRGRHLWGYPAWLAWLFIHLTWLVQFESKLLVLTQWAWNYITRNRSARLITGGSGDERIAA
ncbi:MAG TPA: NAD(P)/FAD-dependent oxidoreductase [Candidatus Polarisedimenticolia bacterium]|nr:NAD(P)/FAD-dependent oxidoreductase [Candidatus Polarisedimenticolia bacterium]